MRPTPHPNATHHRPAATVPLLLLLAAFAARGIALICLLPPGEMWDEYAHLAYVDQWARTGRPATCGQTAIDPPLLAALARLPQPPAAVFGRTYAPFWAGLPAPPLPAAVDLYEAQHPFLYYALAAPMYARCGGAAHVATTVGVLRLVNLALGVGAMALVLRWLARAVGGSAAVSLGCWVTLQPLLLLNVVRVANDALAFFLGTAVVVVALGTARPRARTAALAILLPLAILAKLTNAALLPVVAVALYTAAPPGPPRRRALVAVGVVWGVTALALLPYVMANLHTYGIPTPMTEALVNHAAGRSLASQLRAAPLSRWPVWTANWWAMNGLWVGGWSFLRPPRLFEPAYALLLAVAGAATLRRWRTSAVPPHARRVAVAVVLAVQAGLLFHAAESYAAWQGRMSTNPWYAAVAVPWLLVLLGGGALAIRTRWLGTGVRVGVPLLFVATEAYGTLVLMPARYYAAAPFGRVALGRMAALHPAALGPPTFALSVATTALLLLAVAVRRRV